MEQAESFLFKVAQNDDNTGAKDKKVDHESV